MPLRYAPFRAAALHIRCTAPIPKRPFHSSRALRNDVDKHRNHYETLKVRRDASPAEIKRSFYNLSKTHHPDHNPSDPAAPQRFMRISAAYAVLSHADKRAAYDRDVLHLHPPHARRTGSYHSSSGSSAAHGPAGGRPASGLSRRRGTFRGPPPSFFRGGGWGAHGAKRQAAHEESTGGGGGAATEETRGHGGSGRMGGMGPGQDPYRDRYDDGDVPHFDRVSHERTHRRVDERRARRRAGQDEIRLAPDAGMAASFFVVLGVLATSFVVPFLLLGVGKGRKQENKAEEG